MGQDDCVKLFWGAAMGACVTVLSACSGGSCAASLSEAAVGISSAGFDPGTKLDVRVCIARACYDSALVTASGDEWAGGNIPLAMMKGVQAISVTVRDSSGRTIASDHAVRVHRLEVTQGCTTTIYDAAVRVSPGHIAPAKT